MVDDLYRIKRKRDRSGSGNSIRRPSHRGMNKKRKDTTVSHLEHLKIVHHDGVGCLYAFSELWLHYYGLHH